LALGAARPCNLLASPTPPTRHGPAAQSAPARPLAGPSEPFVRSTAHRW